MTPVTFLVRLLDMTSVTHIHAKVPVDNLASRLKLLRNEMGWSQREAAAATGVHYGTWQGMETGRGTRNVDRHVAAIAANTGYDRDWLMWGGPLTPERPSPESRPTREHDALVLHFAAVQSSQRRAA